MFDVDRHIISDRPLGMWQSELPYRWASDSGSACNNQRVHGEGEDISEGHIPQGCSLACKCCGVECESIYAFMPNVVLPGESFPAIIFLHGYTRGGLQAISEYHLDHLDARNGQPFIIITPNGRQVRGRSPVCVLVRNAALRVLMPPPLVPLRLIALAVGHCDCAGRSGLPILDGYGRVHWRVCLPFEPGNRSQGARD